MVTKADIIHRLRENYPYLAAEYKVQRIGLFGSFAKETFDAASDVDLVVEFQQPIGFRFVELVEHLEQLLERKVDVLTPAGLHGIRVNGVADRIMKEIVYV